MARAGSFGRRPRVSSGNLSSTIAALMRAQQAAEWQAIQDAWKNGGDYNGKPVTDSDLLKYMAGRRDELTKTDPEYAQWANAYSQTKFNVDESKIGLRFKQGAISAQGVADFYKSQLSNFPVDSEIYRTIAGRAADWAKSAADAARGSAGASVTNALNARLYANDATETAFNAMAKIVLDEAVSKGLLTQNQADNGGLSALTDSTAFEAMLEQGVVGPGGQRITTADWTQGLQSVYLAYNDDAAAYAQGGPSYSAAKQTAFSRQSDFTAKYILPTNALGAQDQYQVARDQWGKDLDAAQGNPDAIVAANTKYASALRGIVSKTGSRDPLKGEVPPEMIAGLNSEITLVTTGSTKSPSWFDIQNGGTTDTTQTGDELAKLAHDQDLVASGHGVYGQAKPGGAYGIIDLASVPGASVTAQGVKLPDSFQITTVKVGGVDTPIWLQGRPEYATVVLDTQTGKVLDGAALSKLSAADLVSPRYSIVKDPKVAKLVGYTFSNGDGQPVQYGVIDQNTGKVALFTTENPFTGGLGDGYNVTGGTGGIESGTKLTPDTAIVGPGVAPVTPQGGTVTPGSVTGTAEMDITPSPYSYGGMEPTAPARPDVALQPGQTYTQPTGTPSPVAPYGGPGGESPGRIPIAPPGYVGASVGPQPSPTPGTNIVTGTPYGAPLLSAPTLPELHDSRAPVMPQIKLPTLPGVGGPGGESFAPPMGPTNAPQPGQSFTPPPLKLPQAPAISTNPRRGPRAV